MAAVSAAFTVGGSVSAGGTVTLTLNNPSGINGVVWSIIGNDKSTRVNPTITTSGSSPPGSTASFTFPADTEGLGQSYLVQCFVTDAGSPANTDTSSQIVGLTGPHGIKPAVYGEELERDATYGWTTLVNSLVTGAEPRTGALTSTSDGSAHTVLSVSLAQGFVSRLHIRWVGKRSDGLQVAARESIVWLDNVSGTPAQLGSTVDLLATAKTDATWGALDFVVGPTVAIRVAGKAATNINWYVSYSQLTY